MSAEAAKVLAVAEAQEVVRGGRDEIFDSPAATARRRRSLVRYSRFVSTMKFLLPVAAVLLLIAVGIWPQLQSQDHRFRVGFGAVNAREAMDPGMINPRYVGIDDGNLPYSITADLAKNILPGNEVIELEMPKADMTLEDGSWLVLTAENGIYSRDRKSLVLEGAVNLFHDSGYEIRTQEARIDLDRGVAAGSQRVDGHGPFGELRSEGFLLEDKGAKITFTGKAKLILYPGFGNPVE